MLMSLDTLTIRLASVSVSPSPPPLIRSAGSQTRRGLYWISNPHTAQNPHLFPFRVLAPHYAARSVVVALFLSFFTYR